MIAGVSIACKSSGDCVINLIAARTLRRTTPDLPYAWHAFHIDSCHTRAFDSEERERDRHHRVEDLDL